MSSGSLRRPILAALAAAVLVAVLGGLSTDIGPWYQQLQKPSWQPPDWLFGPVWTLLYATAAVSGVWAWRAASSAAARGNVLLLFSQNAALNVLWSLLFFRLQRPDWALVEVGVLWASTGLLVIGIGRIHARAGAILLPYWVWVSFAAVLNYAIVARNAPFAD
jgi:tryptophan-rich sensory protein